MEAYSLCHTRSLRSHTTLNMGLFALEIPIQQDVPLRAPPPLAPSTTPVASPNFACRDYNVATVHSIAEARHRRALAESTAMQAHRAGSFSRFTLRMSFGPKGKNNLFFLRPSLLKFSVDFKAAWRVLRLLACASPLSLHKYRVRENHFTSGLLSSSVS